MQKIDFDKDMCASRVKVHSRKWANLLFKQLFIECHLFSVKFMVFNQMTQKYEQQKVVKDDTVLELGGSDACQVNTWTIKTIIYLYFSGWFRWTSDKICESKKE